MPRACTPGHVRVEIEVKPEFRDQLDAFRSQYGHTRREEITLALTRHMASPPPVPVPVPAPVVPPLPPVNRGRGRPKKVAGK